MKKFCIILCALIVLLGLLAVAPTHPSRLFEGVVEVFYDYPVDTDCEWVELGVGRVVFCDAKELKYLPRDYFALCFEIELEQWRRFNQIFAVEVVSRELGQGFESALCFCSKIVGGVNIGGQKVNLQVAQTSNGLKIGFPLIVGSF